MKRAGFRVKIEVQKKGTSTGEIDYTLLIGRDGKLNGDFLFTDDQEDLFELKGSFEGSRTTAQQIMGREARNVNTTFEMVLIDEL